MVEAAVPATAPQARSGGVLETATPGPAAPILEARDLSVRAGDQVILKRVDLAVRPRTILGIIGPSGAGKSTLLTCLNRLVDLAPGLTVEGEVLYEGRSIYTREVDPDHLRTRIGILFQQPVVFPRSIYENTLFGLRRVGTARRREWPGLAEAALREAALWDEVKDRLHKPATSLSVGQQQRLCLARTLALAPEVVLMDEPTSALDPRATEAVEELILSLKGRHTVVVVTHDLPQARRISDDVACVCLRGGAGELLECATSESLFTRPQCQDVAAYLRLPT